jgi:hypothetical protein
MKLFIVLITTILTTASMYAQNSYQCGTPGMDSTAFKNKPWVGNNQFLFDLIDSVESTNFQPEMKTLGEFPVEGGFDTEVVFWVPVKTWVYHDDQGDGGINEVRVEQSIRRLNEYFAGEINQNNEAHPHTNIQFYLKCDITYISNSDFATNPSNSEIDDMWDAHHHEGAMNIHYIQAHPDLAVKETSFYQGKKCPPALCSGGIFLWLSLLRVPGSLLGAISEATRRAAGPRPPFSVRAPG